MKILLLLLFLASPLIAQVEGCNTKRDKFTKVTTTQCNGRLKAGLFGAGVDVAVTRNDASPNALGLSFFTSGTEWKLLKRRTVLILADGESISLGEGRHSGDIIRSGVTESLFFIVTRDKFEKIVTAKLVEIRVGDIEGKLDSKTLKKFQDLIK